jgi:type I restriction enzyme, S subunit
VLSDAWSSATLHEIAEKIDYGVTASAVDRPIGPKFLRITDIQNGSVDWNVVPWCECDMHSANDAALRPGDIVFARTGATTGKSFLIRDCPAGAVFASYLIRVRLRSNAEPRYIAHFFKTKDYWAQVTKSARGAAQPGVNASSLSRLRIPLPPLSEQLRIADILDKSDALRANRHGAIAQLDTLAPSIFVDMFGHPAMVTGKIEVLGNLLAFITSGGRGWAKYYAPSGDRFIRSLDVKMNKIDNNDMAFVVAPTNAEARRTRTRSGDVLLTITGSRIGRVASLGPDLEGSYVSQHVAILRPAVERIDPIFLSFFLSLGAGGQRQIAAAQYGQTKPGLNFDQIRQFRIPAVPIIAQQEFRRRVCAIETIRATQSRLLHVLEQLSLSLQHRAFNGELTSGTASKAA